MKDYCQYCQDKVHEVIKCSFIKNYRHCWKYKNACHNLSDCTNEIYNIRTCDVCKDIRYTANSCSKLLNRTNNNKQLSAKILFCNLCETTGHEISNCEYKIMVNKLKSEKQIICQLYEKVCHSRKNCY